MRTGKSCRNMALQVQLLHALYRYAERGRGHRPGLENGNLETESKNTIVPFYFNVLYLLLHRESQQGLNPSLPS